MHFFLVQLQFQLVHWYQPNFYLLQLYHAMDLPLMVVFLGILEKLWHQKIR